MGVRFRLELVFDFTGIRKEAAQYWVKASIGLPFYAKHGVQGPLPHGRYLYMGDDNSAAAGYAVIMSSLFYVCFQALSDCFHVNQGLVEWMPLPREALKSKRLAELGRALDAEVKASAVRKAINTRDGNRIEYDEFQVSSSKRLVDEIDSVLGELWGLDPSQIDVVQQYDAKYRLGGNDTEDES